jgi:hypothetical protein
MTRNYGPFERPDVRRERAQPFLTAKEQAGKLQLLLGSSERLLGIGADQLTT